MEVEANIKSFLSMTSQSQLIFKWDSDINNYIVNRGNQKGYSIKQLLDMDYDSTKEMLIDLYYDENTNINTKQIIKEIIKINKIKK
jgi:hypothetical protein